MSREMTESGIEWIGGIPENWSIRKLKYVTHLREEKNLYHSNKDVFIGLENIESYNAKYIDTATKYTDGFYNKFYSGDLLFSKLRPYLAKCLLPNFSGFCTNELVIIKDFSGDREYLKNLMISYKFIDLINSSTFGTKMPRASWNFIREVEIPYPSTVEQERISTFINLQNMKIDSIIEKTKSTIEDYKLLKQSIITETVTEGLDKNVEMKDSGIEWIGFVPQRWIVTKIKHEAYLRARLGWKGLKADEYIDNGIIFLATPNIKEFEIDFTNVNYITRERYQESPEIKLSVGDVLLTKDGSTLGTLNVVRHLPDEATINGSIALITPSKDLDSIYLYYYLKGSYIQNQIRLKKDGMGVPHLFQRDIREFYILLPSMEEQIEIGEYLDYKCKGLDKLISMKQSLLDNLEQYKKSLIYEYVTGKKEVL